MTKQDVIRQVSAKTDLDPLTSRFVIESFFEVVKSALIEGQPIYIRSFGSFTLKRRASKIARNISKQTALPLAAHVIPYFKPSEDFTNQVKARAMPTNEEETK